MLLALLVVLMVGRIASTHRVFNATFDEGCHIAAGIEMFQAQRYEALAEQPPLSRFALGLPAYLGGARTIPGRRCFEQGKFVLEESGAYWKTLSLGRLGNLLFLPILIYFCFRWSKELYGSTAGVVAVVLITFSPNLLAHAGLATADLAITSTLVGAAYHARRWFQTGEVRSAAAAGCWAGLSLMAKYSAIGFLPPILVSCLLICLGGRLAKGEFLTRKALQRAGVQVAVFVAAIWLIIAACFQLNRQPPAPPGSRSFEVVDGFMPPNTLANRAVSETIIAVNSVAPGFLGGLWKALTHARQGNPVQFLLGEIRHRDGWWYYFPVALAVKSTLPFLLLIGLAISVLCIEGRARIGPGTLAVALGAAAVLVVCMLGELNIGVRHALPIYPFLAILASSLFARGAHRFLSRGAVLAPAVVLVTLHVAESLHAHPDHLPYFNQIARGKEHKFLADSNLDWGQDLNRLAEHLREEGIDEVRLRYFGTTSPATLGIPEATTFSALDRPKGWIAISVSNLQGIERRPDEPAYDFLLSRQPQKIVGKSIWLYHFKP